MIWMGIGLGLFALLVYLFAFAVCRAASKEMPKP